jgi:hypothetical protein
MEQVGYDPNVIHATVHSKCCNHVLKNARAGSVTTPSPWDWHTYTVDWFEDHIQFFIDGMLYYEVWNDGKGWESWPFNHNFRIILNLAVGGTWGGAKGVDPYIWPKTLEVDFVRVYRLAPSASSAVTVQAESYKVMNGVVIEPTNDDGGGSHVGSLTSGDWMSYDVTLPKAGNYKVTYRVASKNTGGSLKIEKAGGSVAYGSVSIPSTGALNTWTNVSHTVSLPTGAQKIGIVVPAGSYNLNWIKFEPQ